MREHRGVCCGFVVMPNHVHAIVWFGEPGALSPFMKSWKQTTSLRLKRVLRGVAMHYASTISLTEPFWQAKYYPFNLFGARKAHEKLQYMHLIQCGTDWLPVLVIGDGVRRPIMKMVRMWACRWSGFSTTDDKRTALHGCAAPTIGRGNSLEVAKFNAAESRLPPTRSYLRGSGQIGCARCAGVPTIPAVPAVSASGLALTLPPFVLSLD